MFENIAKFFGIDRKVIRTIPMRPEWKSMWDRTQENDSNYEPSNSAQFLEANAEGQGRRQEAAHPIPSISAEDLAMIVRFTVEGPPVGKHRARRGAGGRFYTPTPTRHYESRIREAFALASLGKLPKGFDAQWIRVRCFFKNGVHPDPDNVKHSVIDALKGRAYQKDDRRLGSIAYPAEIDRERPRIEVEIEG